MAETRSVTLNKPGWADLSSIDAAGSRDFYSKLFGWSAEVVPDPQAGGYGFFKLDGKDVAGVGPAQNPEQGAVWTVYILVGDADSTARRARESGGAVLMEPMDVMGTGRMAIITDPAGAVIGLWQHGTHAGWEVQGVPGAVCWVELATRDVHAARAFYQHVFGWHHHSPFDVDPGMPYTTFSLAHEHHQEFAGATPMGHTVPHEQPSFWQPYFAVADADASMRLARDLGSTMLMGPHERAEVGRWYVLRDPHGAVFTILQPRSG